MTTWRGQPTILGLIWAFENGKIRTPGDLSAVKNLISQADPDQKQVLRARLTPYLTPSGMSVVFDQHTRGRAV